ncbi:MAG: sugar transferase [Bacteroidales bacterium]|nr:sugar transferase [Bacteroidales bacterium]MDD4216390.1 sugar transferase [Bacteroidales bacterium]MDY0140953.1 sugar transferase [Bacteroidales bacterium]
MQKSRQNFKYIFFDFIAAAISWTLFFSFRKIYIEPQKLGYDIPLVFDTKFYAALIIIPLFWLVLHLLSGYYRVPYRKSRLQELGQTLLTTLLGVIIIFFAFILDDWVGQYKHYYLMFLTLFMLQFTITYIPRLIITTITNKRVHARKLLFNTLIIGCHKKALKLLEEVENQKMSSGLKFVGFVYVDKQDDYLLDTVLPNLGYIDDIEQIIANHKIEEIVIAVESREHCKIKNIINKLQGNKVLIKVIPDMYDILIGKVRMSSIFGLPLIEINHHIMPVWQQHGKRLLDVLLSVFAIIILLPVYIVLSIGVKLSSPGSILYSHLRIGKGKKPFKIYKFRSMFVDAEKNGPALSSKSDNRVTKFGRFMRKTRLDEIPQFFNVLKGDMSIVGPRPERQFFIDEIVKKAPHYVHLLSVRPGITSWGQVKYGYAENVAQMIERLKYDIIYIENRSLYIDFKIMIYTIKIIFQGKGI